MLHNSSNSSPGQSDTSQSVEEFAESLGRLTIADDTFLSPDTISTASTQSDEPTPVILPELREKLSECLESHGFLGVIPLSEQDNVRQGEPQK